MNTANNCLNYLYFQRFIANMYLFFFVNQTFYLAKIISGLHSYMEPSIPIQ